MNVAQRPASDESAGLTVEDWREIQRFARGPRTTYERHLSIDAVFERQAASTPEACAIIDNTGALTYAELDRSANRLARHLRAAGIGAGRCVGVAFERSRNLPVALLAILKAGGAYVPLDPSYPPERLAFIIADADVPVVIVERVTDDRSFGSAAKVINLERDAPLIAVRSEVGLALDTREVGRASNVRAEATAYVMYTSGSTGRPKGVAIAHRGVVRLVRGVDYFETSSDHTFLQFAPAAFDASTFEIWGALLNGARLAIPRPGLLSIDDLGAAVNDFGVTTMWLTASIFQRVVEAQVPAFEGLRQLLTGGSAGSPQHMVRFLAAYPHCRLIAGYGPTENTTFSTTFHLASAQAIGTNPPIGRPIANSTAYVVDERLQPVALDVPGELCVGGDGVGRGYINLPVETAARFIPDPFSDESDAMLYRTGDRVRMRTDGVIEFLGRTDDQVKIHGFRIELGEIEAALRAHPGIRDAAVVTVEREAGEKTLSAHIVPATGSAIDDQLVRTYLRAKLPSYMVPPRITVVPELPVHPSGKIDRVALAASAARSASALVPQGAVSATSTVRSTVSQTSVSPGPVGATMLGRAQLTRSVAEIWRDVLGDDQIPDLHANFFDAGGDSIRLLRLHTLLNERLQAKLTILDLFEHTTVTAIASFIGTCR